MLVALTFPWLVEDHWACGGRS